MCSSTTVLRHVFLTCLLVLVSGNSQLSKVPFTSTIPGDYCKTRADPCCDLRQDDCSAPIFGTLCYCDEFCNRVVNPDCCPDYGRVCQGYFPTPPPELLACYYKGKTIFYNETFQDNCNTCTCGEHAVVSCTNHPCLMDPQLLTLLQAQQPSLGWTAANYSMFWGKRLERGMFLKTGTKEPSYTANKYPVLLHYDPQNIPLEFDARNKWPSLISPPQDQGWCASSWAFSTSSVASDRFAIHSNGLGPIVLSTQNFVDCDKKEDGCKGGRLQRAWNYLRRFGVVDDACYPYTSGDSGVEGNCRVRRGMNLATLRCAGNAQFEHGRTALYRTQPAHRIKSVEADIQFEIMTDGPVQAVMRVYQDFFMYKSGVYRHSNIQATRQNVEHHSVKLLGWGEEYTGFGDTIKYWLAMNSWGRDWGEGGLFRIARGMNESGIEEHILSVRPREEPARHRRRRRRRRHHHSQ